MQHTAYVKYVMCCEALDIDIYFRYKNSVVFSTKKKHITHDGMHSKYCRKIVVISKCKIENHQSISETSRICRGEFLVLQGIISFFTGFPLTVYNSIPSRNSVNPIKHKQQDVHLFINSADYTSDLLILLQKIESEPKLIITLLDRWRKAIYLKQESQDADLFYDEAILSFFHILELFGDCINSELKSCLHEEINTFLARYFKLFYFLENQINQKVEENKKLLGSILIGENLSLQLKIKWFLNKYGMLDDNVSFFIDSVIKIRNAIAHGRISYQDKFVWPLPPFFSLAKDSYENIEILYFLTVRMISVYIGINCWKEEWNEAKLFLLPPKSVIDFFLSDNVEDLTADMLVKNNEHNITWRTIFNHYVKQPQKAFLCKIENKLKNCFLEAVIDENNGGDLFNISIIFADSEDEELRDKAIKNIKIAIRNNWYDWSNFKDAYVYLDFYNVSFVWYKSFLENCEYMDCKN